MSRTDTTMLDLFRQELETQSEELTTGLMRLEQRPSDTGHVAAMMRAAHSIKGAARIVGFSDAVRVAHALEDCFERLHAGRVALAASDCDHLLACVDLLQRYREPSSPDDGAALAALARDAEPLLARLAGLAGASPSKLPEPIPVEPVAAAPDTRRARASVASVSPLVEQFRASTVPSRGALAEATRAAREGRLTPAVLADGARAAASLVGYARLAGLPVAKRLALLAQASLATLREQGKPEPDAVAALVAAAELIDDASAVASLAGELPHDAEARVAAVEARVRGNVADVDPRSGPAPEPPASATAPRAIAQAPLAQPAIPQAPPAPLTPLAPPVAARPPIDHAPPLAPPAIAQAPVAPAAPPAIAHAPLARPAPPPAPLASPAAPAVAIAPPPPLGSAAVIATLRNDVAAAPGAVTTLAESPGQTARFVRITSENLDRLMGLAGESLVQVNWLQPFADSLLALKASQYSPSVQLERLSEVCADDDERAGELLRRAFADLHAGQELMNERIAELEHYARCSVGLSDRLYREVVQSRMRPIADSVRGFPRMVRDLARKLGKWAHLEIEGDDTHVDRDILEKLEAPLNHLLRNAVDHGIEGPEERASKGKPEQGSIVLRAAHRAGMLWIQIIDDGRGIDLARIRERIVARSVLSAEAAGALGESELIDFLFTPGFTTTDAVTEISGRGVGLDVVRSTVGSIGGSVHASSEPGRGSVFELELPLTLSVVRALLVEISGEAYALPVTRLERILRLEEQDVFTVQGRRCCSWNGHNIGLVPAALVLELDVAPRADVTNVIVLRDRNTRVGLCVDKLLGEHDLVVRPITKRLGKIPDVSAASVLSDGGIVLIIDVDDVLRTIARLNVAGRLGASAPPRKLLQLIRRRVLVVDDSESIRELECRLLEGAGYEAESAADGGEALAHLAASPFDLVITDADMPRLDGFELIRRIRATPAHASIPIAMVSYNESDEYRARALEIGADRYLTKSRITTGAWIDSIVGLIGGDAHAHRDHR